MEMRLDHAAIRPEVPCGTCRSQFVVEGDVTLPGSLRETTSVLHASAMAVVESAETSQDRGSVTGRVIFCVLYTQGESKKVDSIEAAAEFTHLCDVPGAIPRAEVTAYVYAEHVEASVQNGRMMMRAQLRVHLRAMAVEAATPVASIEAPAVQQKQQQLMLRSTTGRGAGDALLREEFALPADLMIQNTLAAWATVSTQDATGGQERIGLNGEVTLEAIHASALPGKPLVMTRHVIPVHESVELKGETGELLEGQMRVKDVAVASQDMSDGERTLRAEVLLGLSAWAEREETVTILSDAYTTSGDELRLKHASMTLRTGEKHMHAAESGKASLLLPEGSKPLRTVLAAFATPVLTAITQQGNRLIAEGMLEANLVYMSDEEMPVAAKAETPFRVAFAASAAQDDIVLLTAANVEALPITSDRAELRYILHAWIDGLQAEDISFVTEVSSTPACATTNDIVLYFAQPGEGAWEIARRYRITESELRVLNPELTEEPQVGQGVIVWRKQVV